MQLILLAALLYFNSNSGLCDIIKPLIQASGDSALSDSFEEAQALADVMTAVYRLSTELKEERGDSAANNTSARPQTPLAPIADIADKNIAAQLKQYLYGAA